MQISDELNVIIRGRKFKKMSDAAYENLRDKYGLKQIEVELLIYLSQWPNDSASVISRNFYINKGQISQAMNNLCEKGYLKAHMGTDDRRYVSYEITDQGRPLVKEIITLKDSIINQLLKGVSYEDMKLVAKVAAIVSENLDRIKL